MHNWAGNHQYGAIRVHEPDSLDSVRQIVSGCRQIKAMGTRHSFNDIADTTADHLSLSRLNQLVRIDRDQSTVTVQAGATYGQLCRELHRQGLALHNLASLPHISVGGACATATHGSGDRNGVLASAVEAMQLVIGSGDVVELSRKESGGEFAGAVVGLGALGVVTELTLKVSPAFRMRQDVFENLPFAVVIDRLDEIFLSAYSVSLFTDWKTTNVNQVWMKQRVDEGAPKFDPMAHGATPALTHLHPLSGMPAENCTQQMSVEGDWHERLPHFRMEFTPSAGEELQSEYLVPRPHAAAALQAIHALREQIAPLLHVSEIRSIAADDLWMSPCYRQACIGIHFTWKKDWPRVRDVLPLIEQQLSPFHARPHWGKLFLMSGEQIQSLYPRLNDFRELMRKFDPLGKFRNAFLDRCLF